MQGEGSTEGVGGGMDAQPSKIKTALLPLRKSFDCICTNEKTDRDQSAGVHIQ